MLKRMSAKEARDNFGELLSSVHFTKQPVVIEKHGKPYALLVNIDRLDVEVERGLEAMERVRRLNEDADPYLVMADADEAIAEVRAELAAEEQIGPSRGR